MQIAAYSVLIVLLSKWQVGKISTGGIFVELVFWYAYCLVRSGLYIHAAHLKVDISIYNRDICILAAVHLNIYCVSTVDIYGYRHWRILMLIYVSIIEINMYT
jgi:hypothetical protein